VLSGEFVAHLIVALLRFSYVFRLLIGAFGGLARLGVIFIEDILGRYRFEFRDMVDGEGCQALAFGLWAKGRRFFISSGNFAE